MVQPASGRLGSLSKPLRHSASVSLTQALPFQTGTSPEAIPEGSRVVFRAEETRHYVHTSSVAVLLIAAVGGVLTVLWPFYPKLLPVAPFGADHRCHRRDAVVELHQHRALLH